MFDYVKKNFVTFVIGLPGSGKTYYVEHNLKNGVAYDLDYLAAAIRLKDPHSERNDPARSVAYDLIYDFVDKSRRYAKNIFIIRTAPSLSEISKIKPDKIVVCKGKYNIRNRQDHTDLSMQKHYDLLRRIQTVINEAKKENIEIEEIS